MQDIVDQDKGRTPQGSNGSPQASRQEAGSAGGPAKFSALPAQSTAMGPAAAAAPSVSAYKAPASQPVSPSPTASKENEDLQVHSRGTSVAFGAKAGAAAGFRALDSPEGHGVALKPCASETAAREPMLSPTRVLLKG